MSTVIAFADGFDTADMTTEALIWDSFSFNLLVLDRTGRYSGQACLTWNAGSVSEATKTLPRTSQTVLVNFNFRVIAAHGNSDVLRLYDASGTLHIVLSIDSSGIFTLKRNTTTLGTGSTALTVGTWYTLELKVKIDSSTGTYEFRINSTAEISGTGNTQNGGAASVGKVQIYNVYTFASHSNVFDDFWVADDSGGDPGFVGDSKILTNQANANGATNNFTPSAGSNYQNVDEVIPNGDTDYNSASTVGDRDLYAITDFGITSEVILALAYHVSVRQDAGSRKIKPACKSGSTVALGDEVTLSSSYGYPQTVLNQDPATSARWTSSGLDAAQIGLDITV